MSIFNQTLSLELRHFFEMMQQVRSLIGWRSKPFDCCRAPSRDYQFINQTYLSGCIQTLKEFRFLYWLHPFCSNDSATWLIFLQFYFPNGLIVLSNHNLLPPKPKLINIHVRYYVNWNHNHEIKPNQMDYLTAILQCFATILSKPKIKNSGHRK